MSKRDEALKREMARLREYAATTRTDHDRSARFTDKHVEGLSAVLRPRVANALRDEVGLTLAANQWVAEARTVATWLLRTGAVDVQAIGKPPPARSAGAWARIADLKQFLDPEQSPEQAAASVSVALPGSEAERKLVDSLAIRIKSSEYYEVSNDEVTEHSTDLARLLISNWFGALEDAVQAQPDEAVKLEYRAFPPSASAGVVTEGCEAFALPAEQAISLVFEYQKSLAGSGQVVELSPIVSLYRSKAGPWYAFETQRPSVVEVLRGAESSSLKEFAEWVTDAFSNMSLPGAGRRPQPSLALEHAVALATQSLSPLAIGRALQLQGNLSMRTALVHQCSLAAAKVVRLRLRDQPASVKLWASAGSAVGCAYAPTLTTNIARVLLQDLDSLSDHNEPRGVDVALLRLAASLEERGGVPLPGDVYMLALPTAAAVLAGAVDETPDLVATMAPDVPAMLDEEELLVSAAVDVVTSVMAASESQSDHELLGRNIRRMLERGHEPSAFGLLA